MTVVYVVLGILACLVLVIALRPGRTAPIRDAQGRLVPGGIASLEDVELGGVRQRVLIRGVSTANPILLFLHGGPGTSELPMLRRFNLPALERHFTVVVWDQRGAGASFSARRPEAAMTVDQLVADTRDLAEQLCRRFDQPRIFLAGHSWGSALGVLTVHRHPERFAAYVGIGQVANVTEGERLNWRWTLDRAREAGDARAVARLEALGEPPYRGDLRKYLPGQRALLARYGGEVHGDSRGGMPFVLGSLLRCREFAWRDRVNFFRGIFWSMRVVWPQILAIDLERQCPRLAVPVYFLLGRHDMEVPSGLAERYFQRLEAPRKALVWFERSAHFINCEEPEAFNRFFVERLLADGRGEEGAVLSQGPGDSGS